MTESDVNQAKLSADVIENELRCRLSGTAKTFVYDSLGSTNTWLTENFRQHADASGKGLLVCAAEHQTAGRGRRGKVWHTPKMGVTFSLCFTLPVGLSDVAGLSLITGSVVCDWLWRHAIDRARIKWPNDILVGDAKLVGILVEVVAHTAESSTLVVGIGVNYQRGEELNKIDQASTDLFSLCGDTPPDRSQLIGELAAGVYLACNENPVLETVAGLSADWSRYDALAGVPVSITSGDETISGHADGIERSGALRIKTASGVSVLSSGDVSLRRG